MKTILAKYIFQIVSVILIALSGLLLLLPNTLPTITTSARYCSLLFSLGMTVLAVINGQHKQRLNELKTGIHNLEFNIPSSDQYSAEFGLRHLALIIKHATKVYNTSIISEDYNTKTNENKIMIDCNESWRNSLLDFVNDGRHLYEVVSRLSGNNSSRINNSDYYTCKELDTVPPLPFINFTIIEFAHGKKEVWFGWLSTKSTIADRKCYRSANQELCGLFIEWFNELNR